MLSDGRPRQGISGGYVVRKDSRQKAPMFSAFVNRFAVDFGDADSMYIHRHSIHSDT